MHNGKGNRLHNDHDYMSESERNIIVVTYAYVDDLQDTGTGIDVYKIMENMFEEQNRKHSLIKKISADEITIYNQLYGKTLDRYNANRMKERHPERRKHMLDWFHDDNKSPWETIFQIGNKDCCPVDMDQLMECVEEFHKWEKKTLGRNVVHLSTAGHLDETTYHVHDRKTFVYHNPTTGLPEPSVKKALEQAGIPLPDPSKKEGQHNNRRMVYDEIAREAWYDIVEKHLPLGYELDREPDADHPEHLEPAAYKRYKKAEARLQAHYTALETQLQIDTENHKTEIRNTLETSYKVRREILERRAKENAIEIENKLREDYRALGESLQSDYDNRLAELENLIKGVSDYQLNKRADRLKMQKPIYDNSNTNDFQFGK